MALENLTNSQGYETSEGSPTHDPRLESLTNSQGYETVIAEAKPAIILENLTDLQGYETDRISAQRKGSLGTLWIYKSAGWENGMGSAEGASEEGGMGYEV